MAVDSAGRDRPRTPDRRRRARAAVRSSWLRPSWAHEETPEPRASGAALDRPDLSCPRSPSPEPTLEARFGSCQVRSPVCVARGRRRRSTPCLPRRSRPRFELAGATTAGSMRCSRNDPPPSYSVAVRRDRRRKRSIAAPSGHRGHVACLGRATAAAFDRPAAAASLQLAAGRPTTSAPRSLGRPARSSRPWGFIAGVRLRCPRASRWARSSTSCAATTHRRATSRAVRGAELRAQRLWRPCPSPRQRDCQHASPPPTARAVDPDDLPPGVDVPSDYGLIEVIAAPGARVRVDGAVAGVGPKVDAVAAPGFHEIRVDSEGDERHVIEVRAGKTARIRPAQLP